MATPRLSKEAEAKITDSLTEAADLVNSGLSPNEAIAKTASASGVPVGHLEIMVRAYNTGRSEAQRQGGADHLEKLADFELAELPVVIEKVYPSHVKTASSIIKTSAVSNVYSRPPAHIKPELKPLGKLALGKLAFDNRGSLSSKTSIPLDTLGYTRTVSALIEKLGRDSEKIRMDSSHSKDMLMEGITKLSKYFSSFGNVPFTVAKDNSIRLFGKKADHLFNIMSNSNKAFKKQASTVAASAAPVDILKAPYSLINDCVNHASAYVNKQASVAYLNSLVKAAIPLAFGPQLPKENTGSVLDGLTKKAADDPSMWNRFNTGVWGAGKGVYDYAKYTPETAVKQPDALDKVERDNDQIKQRMTLKNIRASTAVSDLMANDSVIGAHHPEDITFHFNELASISPEMATNPALMRPFLRQRLEGGDAAISPVDAQQALDVSGKLTETQQKRVDTASITQDLLDNRRNLFKTPIKPPTDSKPPDKPPSKPPKTPKPPKPPSGPTP